MLGAARHVDFRVPDEAGQRAADKGAGVAGGGDVRIVQHGVAMAAQPAVVAGLGLAKEGNELRALLGRELPGATEPKACKRRAYRLDIDRVNHDRMIDCERDRTRPTTYPSPRFHG